jgi:hypothetical protein
MFLVHLDLISWEGFYRVGRNTPFLRQPRWTFTSRTLEVEKSLLTCRVYKRLLRNYVQVTFSPTAQFRGCGSSRFSFFCDLQLVALRRLALLLRELLLVQSQVVYITAQYLCLLTPSRLQLLTSNYEALSIFGFVVNIGRFFISILVFLIFRLSLLGGSAFCRFLSASLRWRI